MSGDSWKKRRRAWKRWVKERRKSFLLFWRRRSLEAEKKERRKKAAKGPSALSLRYKKFQLWRLRQKETRAARWSKRRSKYRVLDWIYKRQNYFFWMFFLGLAGVFCFVLFSESKSGAIRSAKGPVDYGDRVAVRVNGKPISHALLARTLEQTYGPSVLQKLTEQEVVRQEAERLKIEMSAEERAFLEDRLRADPDRFVHESELVTSLLLRKIALNGVSKERKREVYESFKEDLKLYTLSGLRFPDRDTAAKFDATLKQGTEFSIAAGKYSTDGSKPMLLGSLTISQIRDQFGQATADAVEACEIGQLTQALRTVGGVAIYRVEKVGTSFEEVETAIDTLIAEAESTQILYNLLANAEIDSPFLDSNRLADESPSPSPTPADTATPTPAEP